MISAWHDACRNDHYPMSHLTHKQNNPFNSVWPSDAPSHYQWPMANGDLLLSFGLLPSPERNITRMDREINP